MASLSDLVQAGMRRAAEVLATMLDSRVELAPPGLRLVGREDLVSVLAIDKETVLSAVEMDFSGQFSGSAGLLFISSEAGRLVDCVLDGLALAEDELEAMRNGTLCEVGNIVINAVIGTVANLLRIELSYSVPLFLHGPLAEVIDQARVGAERGGSREGEIVILIGTRFQVEKIHVEGDIAVLLSLDSFKGLEEAIIARAHG